MKENLRYILTLTIICFFTATLLTAVYLLTRPKILEQKLISEQKALREVLSPAEYFEPVVKDAQVAYFKAYLSADKKQMLGYAFMTQAKGYSSVIETVAGVDRYGNITGIKIIAQNETPGLGAKIAQVETKKTLGQAIKDLFAPKNKLPQMAEQPQFCVQFKGKKIEDLIVVDSPTEENIQAITGATISSQALTDSVREKAEQILQYER